MSNNKRNRLLVLILTCLFIFTVTLDLSKPSEGYHSNVDTLDNSYFKVLDLQAGITYNFTIDVEEYYQMDLGFSIHLDERPKEKNALLTVDSPGTGDESALFIPEFSGNYYILVYSNYDWGFFDIYVSIHPNGAEMVVEPYSIPINWTWLWVVLGIGGGIVVIVILAALGVYISKVVVLSDIKLPKIRLPEIDVDWSHFRERRRARRAQRKARRRFLFHKRAVARERKRKEYEKMLEFEDELENQFTEGISIIHISDTTQRCMVSGLEFDFENEEIVACPHCENIAKKPMLTEWLKVKGICPICRTRLVIDHCPKVKLD